MRPQPPAIPTFESARLTFRGHRVDDLDDSAAMWGDPVVTRHIGGRPFTREEVWARLLRYVGHWALLGYGFWAVHERSSNRFVGEVGFADFKRGLGPALDGVPEMGWVLAPWAHGKGFATEAVNAALQWARTELPVPRAFCIIDHPNLPSVNVAKKCAFTEMSVISYKDHPVRAFDISLR